MSTQFTVKVANLPSFALTFGSAMTSEQAFELLAYSFPTLESVECQHDDRNYDAEFDAVQEQHFGQYGY